MICIVTDAWLPQINGVVTTLVNLKEQLEKDGHEVFVIEPSMFKSFSLPGYKEIKICYEFRQIRKLMKFYNPKHIHIATEGPLGLAARMYCTRNKLQFTTSFHTKFAEFIKARIPVFPLGLGYAYLKWFHSGASRVLVTTNCMKEELEARGFKNMVVWTRGVDRTIFKPRFDKSSWRRRSRKSFMILYVGRVSHEKNIKDFCRINPYNFGRNNVHVMVVGDGPARKELEGHWPHVEFVGSKTGDELAQFYRDADVFVFPSVNDTFGVVLIESIASGTPIATYPVTGPKSVVIEGVNGSMDDNLTVAIANCLDMNRKAVYETSLNYTWERCKDIFLENLIPIEG
jgi:glycosyltransferase involved in cell wall biosynthesis